MLDSFLRHVTKDSYGPVSFIEKTALPAVVHKFNDSFSVMNWGKMPDALQDKGRTHAFLFTHLNQRFQSRDSWKNFLRSPEALSFRKAGASIAQAGNVSAMLNEMVERLPIRSNFLGVIDESQFRGLDQRKPLTAETITGERIGLLNADSIPMLYPVCEYFQEEKVPHATVMGRAVWDFSFWKSLPDPKLLPFEMICHFVLNEESLKRLKIDSVSIPKTASLHTLQSGSKWDFPLMEMVLPQDPLERRIGLSEALSMTGFSANTLQEVLLTAAWISAWTRSQMAGLNLESIRLRFAVDSKGELILVDGFSLDDLHLERDGVSYHPENSLQYYQKTSWFEGVAHAQKHASSFGLSDWKRLCVEPAPWLDPKVKSQLENEYKEIAKHFLGKTSCLSE